jgi:hypothetical protein
MKKSPAIAGLLNLLDPNSYKLSIFGAVFVVVVSAGGVGVSIFGATTSSTLSNGRLPNISSKSSLKITSFSNNF